MSDVVDQIADATEATHDPGEDHEFESYLGDVRELVPDADQNIVLNLYRHEYDVQGATTWLKAYENYMKRPTTP